MSNTNITVTITRTEASIIIDSLNHSLPGWMDAVRDSNTRLLAAMIEHNEAIVYECIAEIRAAVARWECQRELIREFEKHAAAGE